MPNHSGLALSTRDKAALVLLALDPEQSAALLSGLGTEEAALLSEHLSRLADIDPATRSRVMEEFQQALAQPGTPSAPVREAPAPPGARSPAPRLEACEASPPPGEAVSARRGVRKLDFANLERVSSRAVTAARPPTPGAIALPQDLPIGCRAELPALSLPVATLAELGVGDVLLLKPGPDARVDLVGGEGCRFPGKLREIGGQRAVEILSDTRPEDETNAPAASDTSSAR